MPTETVTLACACCGGGCCPDQPDTLTLTLSIDPASDPACDFTCDSGPYPRTVTLTKVTYTTGECAGSTMWEGLDLDGGTEEEPGLCTSLWQLVGCRLVQRLAVSTNVCTGGSNTADLTVVSCDPVHLTGSFATLSPFCAINVDITE